MSFRSLSVVLSLSAISALAQPGSVFPTKEEKDMAKLLQEQAMSSEVRAFLKGKMKSHNKDMRDLVMAVATLRFDDAKKWSQGIANTPRLDANSSGKLELPPSFFALQDVLRKQAGAVVTAAEAKNADELVTSFTTMVGTCAGCHKAFMTPVKEKTDAKPVADPAKK
jgi:hypothetical protein